MDIQVDYFNITREQLGGLLGKSQANGFLAKKAIFWTIIGANDFLNNYLIPWNVGPDKSLLPDEFIGHVIHRFKDQLRRLYSLCARKFAVANIPPIGCIPYQKNVNVLNTDGCMSIPNLLAERFNNRLSDLLIDLNNSLLDAKCVLANLYNILVEVVTNYQTYGFKRSSIACCGNGGPNGGVIPCGPASSLYGDRYGHVYWDPYHPSEATNLIIAKRLVDGEINYVSPITLRQLKDL